MFRSQQILRSAIRRTYATTATAAPSASTAASTAAGTAANAAAPVRKPRRIGAFRGGFLGFLLGVSITGFGSYYYLIDEYRAANRAIVGDVLALEKTIGSLEEHVRLLESKVK